MLASSSLSKYKDGVYPMPSDDVSPEEKSEKKWNLDWMCFLTSQYVNDWCGIRFNSIDKINELREYAFGTQDPNKYKNYYLGKEIPGETRKGWMNVNFNLIFSPAPMIMNKIVSMIEEVEHDITVDATDEKSGYEKESKKAKLWLKKLFKPELDEINQAIGVQPDDEILPESKEELELYASIGGTKLPYEIFIEKCLGHTFDISNDHENKRKIIYDLASIYMAATLDEVDMYEQKVYEKYIDIADLIIEYNPNTNFDKSRYGGYSYFMTVAEVMAETGLEGGKIIHLAQQNSGKYGNPQWNEKYANNRTGVYGFESWRIPVIYAAYKTVNQRYQTKKDGNYYPAKFGEKWGDKSKKDTVITDYQVVYHAKWIPGTEIIWNYGLMNDIPGNGNLPFHVYKIPGKSIIEQLIPVLDDIQCANLRYQNNLSKAPPPGGFIDQRALTNLEYGGKKMSNKEALKMFFQTGWLLYNGQSIGGNPNISAPVPITPSIGGAGTAITEAVESFRLACDKIALVTGFDPITLSNPASQDNPVSNQKMAMASTNTVLKSLYSGYIDMRESFCRNAASRIQLICKYNKDDNKGYYGVIGRIGVDSIAAMGNKKASMVGIRIQARATEAEKAIVMEAAANALKGGKSGKVAMPMSLFFFIQRMINMPGGYKYCQALMANWEAKQNEKELQLAQINMEQNKKLEVEAVIAKNKAEMQLITHTTNEEIRKMVAEHMITTEAKTEDFKNELIKYGIETGISNSQLEQQNAMQQNAQATP